MGANRKLSRNIKRASKRVKPTIHPPVYRFFKESNHADALANGNVWLSTLETCRKYEDSLQGDPEEGIHQYNSGYIHGHGHDPDLQLIASRCSISIGPKCKNVTLSNNISITRLPDAFVLCTTQKFSPEHLNKTFGIYCVEISNPELFFKLTTRTLSTNHQIKYSGFRPVIYRNRHFAGLEQYPGPIGFVKPPDLYEEQKEARFLWEINTREELTPFLLTVPGTAQLCKRIA